MNDNSAMSQGEPVALWKCGNCHHEFTPTAANWTCGINAEYLAPDCPACKACNQYTYPLNAAAIAEKIEKMGFICDGGPLSLSDEWQKLKHAICTHPAQLTPIGYAELSADGKMIAYKHERDERCCVPVYACTERPAAPDVTDTEIEAWAIRHGFDGWSRTDRRAAFDDARTWLAHKPESPEETET